MNWVLKYIIQLVIDGLLSKVLVPFFKGMAEKIKLGRIFKKSKKEGQEANDKVDNATTVDDARRAMDELN